MLRYGEEITQIEFTSDKKEINLILIWQDDGMGIPEKEKAIFSHTVLGACRSQTLPFKKDSIIALFFI